MLKSQYKNAKYTIDITLVLLYTFLSAIKCLRKSKRTIWSAWSQLGKILKILIKQRIQKGQSFTARLVDKLTLAVPPPLQELMAHLVLSFRANLAAISAALYMQSFLVKSVSWAPPTKGPLTFIVICIVRNVLLYDGGSRRFNMVTGGRLSRWEGYSLFPLGKKGGLVP